jgi:hypothetical protein
MAPPHPVLAECGIIAQPRVKKPEAEPVAWAAA